MIKMITTVFNQLVISDPFEIHASKTRTRCHLQTNFDPLRQLNKLCYQFLIG